MSCIYICKICKNCGRILPLISFHKHSSSKFGRRSICKQCRTELERTYNDEYRNNHKEHYKEYRNNHKEHYKEYNDEYRNNHKEYFLNYRNNHKEYFLNYRNNRRSKTKKNEITKEQWIEMMDFFEWKCAYSGIYIGNNSKNRTIDHIIPLSKNGENVIWNMVPMYMPYNSSKYNKDMLTWYKQQEFYSDENLDKIRKWQEYAYNKWSR